MYQGPIIDVHTHPMLSARDQLTARPHPPEEYRKLAGRCGITRAAALTIARAGEPAVTAARNDAVLDLAASSAGFYWPACSVHPGDGPAAFTELDRIAGAGCRWLKLHPNVQDFDVLNPEAEEVVRHAAGLGMVVLSDAYCPWDLSQPGKFARLAMRVSSARLVLAHAYGPGFPQLLLYRIMDRYPQWRRQVWVDISATAPLLAGGPFAEQFTWTLREIGVDRVLFGSDYPVDNPEVAVDAVVRLGFTDAEQAAILHDNAAALLSG